MERILSYGIHMIPYMLCAFPVIFYTAGCGCAACINVAGTPLGGMSWRSVFSCSFLRALPRRRWCPGWSLAWAASQVWEGADRFTDQSDSFPDFLPTASPLARAILSSISLAISACFCRLDFLRRCCGSGPLSSNRQARVFSLR